VPAHLLTALVQGPGLPEESRLLPVALRSWVHRPSLSPLYFTSRLPTPLHCAALRLRPPIGCRHRQLPEGAAASNEQTIPVNVHRPQTGADQRGLVSSISRGAVHSPIRTSRQFQTFNNASVTDILIYNASVTDILIYVVYAKEMTLCDI
jgi:hypothetical protein